MLRACKSLLKTIRRDRGAETINVGFLKEDISDDMNGLYTSKEVRRMLDGKDFDELDSVLPFVAGFDDTALCEQNLHPMTHVHTNFRSLYICKTVNIWSMC